MWGITQEQIEGFDKPEASQVYIAPLPGSGQGWVRSSVNRSFPTRIRCTACFTEFTLQGVEGEVDHLPQVEEWMAAHPCDSLYE